MTQWHQQQNEKLNATLLQCKIKFEIFKFSMEKYVNLSLNPNNIPKTV